MNAGAIAGLALVAGLLLGALIVWLVMRRPAVREVQDFVDPPVEVPAGVSQVLSVFASSGVVVGPHDEVLESTTQARTLGIVRGSRVNISELLDLVRTVRIDRVVRSADLELRRAGAGSAVSYLAIRVAPLDDDLVLILADDRTAAVRVEETRRDFVANVSHELKTPIGAVALLAEALEGAADDPEVVHRFAERLGVEAQRLTDLVSQIIDLSRLQADDPLIQADVVDIDEVLTKAVDRAHVDAEKRDVQLTIAGERRCQVLGSERQLVIAIGNLVENAIIYSDPGARVAVAAHRVLRGDDETVEITVSDNGIGIAQADLSRIFERFYRVDYARSRSNGGTGLGLSIVKHIAAAHGGNVSVWSELGQGSTFTVSLPGTATSDQPVIAGNAAGRADRDVSLLTPERSDSRSVSTHPSSDGRLRGDAEPVNRRTTRTQEIVR